MSAEDLTEYTFIDLNERAYKYIRQFTIKSLEDAAVELITNCIDAYNKDGITPRKIFIEYKNPGQAIFRDNAIGLTAAEMQSCFLQVGNYTTSDEARGFFSRGAKDISAIGNISFEAIKDGRYSRILLNSEAYGAIDIADAEVDEAIRADLKMPGDMNGLQVTIDLLSNFYLSDLGRFTEALEKLGVLREIMQSPDNYIYFTHYDTDNSVKFERELLYTPPTATLLLDLTYNVPNYEEATATFKVYKSEEPIDQPIKENELEFGFIIGDSSTVYETNTVDDRFRWNPYINVVYGSLKCDYIKTLLLDYDTNGASAKNPMPIIDPSRLTGTNKEHPFIQSLLSIPKVRIDQILRELNTSLSEKSITIHEVDQLLSELEKFGLNIFDEEDVTVSFQPSYDSELAKAIEDDRLNYVTSEKSYLMTTDFNTHETDSDNYIKEQILHISPVENPTQYAYVVGTDGELEQIALPDQIEQDNPDQILELMSQEQVDSVSSRPYIYQISANGDLVKLYVFERGRIENVTNPENEYVILKNKKFSISFINDVHINKRYVIEYTDGIHIKLNLNNDSILKYLATTNIEQGATDLSVTNLKSSVSLVFLQELIIEVIANIITQNDIINNKLILDDNTYNNSMKLHEYHNNTVSKIEGPIELIFDRYISDSKGEKYTELSDIIGTIGSMVGEHIDLETNGQDLVSMKQFLEEKLGALLE